MNEENDEPDQLSLDEVSRQNFEGEPTYGETTLRSTSPLPRAPFPYKSKEKLSIGEQFEYVKPVLAAVIEGEYEPAKQRHVDFMRGAAARRNVCESGYSRGSLRPREVEELLDLVMRWSRRREKRKELGIPLSHVDPSHGKPATLSQDVHVDSNSQVRRLRKPLQWYQRSEYFCFTCLSSAFSRRTQPGCIDSNARN